MKVFLQTRIVPEKKAQVSVFDHGFLYGDGIYETVRAYDYQIFRWPEHYKRLKQSAARLALKCPWSSAFLLRGVTQVLKANHSPRGSVRITVARGPGPLGLDPSVCPDPTLVMLLHPERPLDRLWKNGVSIGIPKIRRTHPQCLDPHIKSNNSLNTILAKMEAKRMNVFEAVLLNLDGYLTEGTTTNIFFIRRGRIYTPALSCGLLEGVTRAAVLKLARPAKIPIREGRYRLHDLLRADEIFLTSTTLEIVPVVSVLSAAGRRRFAPGPITRRLHALFRGLV